MSKIYLADDKKGFMIDDKYYSLENKPKTEVLYILGEIKINSKDDLLDIAPFMSGLAGAVNVEYINILTDDVIKECLTNELFLINVLYEYYCLLYADIKGLEYKEMSELEKLGYSTSQKFLNNLLKYRFKTFGSINLEESNISIYGFADNNELLIKDLVNEKDIIIN